MWDKKDLNVIRINMINNIMSTANMEGFSRVNSGENEYVQGFLLRGDTRPFNTIFTEGFAPQVQIQNEQQLFAAKYGSILQRATGALGVSTTACYNIAALCCSDKGHVYMIDARKKLGFPIRKTGAYMGQNNPFSEVNFIDGFPGTDVVGFISQEADSGRYHLVCNPDYSGDFNYIEHIINHPFAATVKRKRAPAYSRDFLRSVDNSECVIGCCTIL